jgi:hypothetical protein
MGRDYSDPSYFNSAPGSDDDNIEKIMFSNPPININQSGLADDENGKAHLLDLLDNPQLYPCSLQTYAPKALYRAMLRRNTRAVQQAAQEGGTKLKRILQWYHLMGYGFASTVGAGRNTYTIKLKLARIKQKINTIIFF